MLKIIGYKGMGFMMKKEQSKLSKIFITILMALTCVQNIAVFAEEPSDNSDENGIMLAANNEKTYTIAVGETITLEGGRSATGASDLWMIEDTAASTQGSHVEDKNNAYGKVEKIQDLSETSKAKVTGVSPGTFTVCHYYYSDKESDHGGHYQHYIVNVVANNSANFQATLSNAEIAYIYWHNASEAGQTAVHTVQKSGNITIQDFTRDSEPGYVVFFIKPNANYLITGFDNNGTRGDIYPLDGNNFGDISGYPGLSSVINVAKKLGLGYACFGYSSSANGYISTSFKVEAQNASASIDVTANKLDEATVGSSIPITVTITPQVLDRTSISNVAVTAQINGTDVTVSDVTGPTDGKYTATISYHVTFDDLNKGYVRLKLNAKTTYETHVATVGDSEIKTNFVVNNSNTIEQFEILNKGKVQYQFNSTDGQKLPEEVMALLPSDDYEYFIGKTITPKNPKDSTIRVDDGVWTFDKWDAASKTMTKDGISFTGSWKFTQKTGKAGYYLVLKEATWENDITPTGITAYQEDDKTKYYYNKKLSKDETFVVVEEKPTAEGYQFIGWLDKKRGNQAAAIRKAGDTLTYIYKEDENRTYTLDALWANISVQDVEVLYDGQPHTFKDVEIAINEGTALDDKYKEQAKALISIPEGSKILYSTDEENWSETKPTFTDAGTYTVHVKEDVVVGGQTVTLVGQGTVTINKRKVTLTSESKSKEYDGKALTAEEVKVEGDGFVSGEVSNLKAIGTITNVGEVTNTITYTTDAKFNKDNYEITLKEGKLTITEKKSDPTPTASSETKKSTSGWDDGGPFTTDTCGNVYDRWGNKIYEAKGCNVGGYNLVRTSTIKK